jgi:hypothetical protein
MKSLNIKRFKVILFAASASVTALFLTENLHSQTAAVIKDSEIRQSIVLVRVSTVRNSYREPWVKVPGDSYKAAGVVLPGNRILVLASDVRDAGFLEVNKYSSYTPAKGVILKSDMEANLAILTVNDKTFFNDLKPLTLGSDPKPGKNGSSEEWFAVKVDERFQVYREKAGHGEIDASADYGYTHTPIYSFRTVEAFGSGGLLLKGKALGAFIQYADQNKKTRSIPVSVIKAFIERNMKPVSDRSVFIAHGILFSELTDPVFREYMKLPGGVRGVLITGTLPGTSAYGVLKEKDILVQADGFNLDERGFYEDPVYGRESISLLFARKPDGIIRKSGDKIALKIIREGKPVDIQMELTSYRGGAERIPWIVNGPANFLLESGLVFTDLSVPYLRESFGNNWKARAVESAYHYDTARHAKKETGERIVVISSVLPDEVNRSYESFTHQHIVSVAGEKVLNTDHMIDLLHKAISEKKEFLEITLANGNRIYLDLKNRDQINSEISSKYNVPFLNHRERR